MKYGKARLWEVMEEAALAVTDPITGRFEQKIFVDELRGRLNDEDLPSHVRAASLDEAAERLASSFVEKRKPKPRTDGCMFHPSALLPLGHGKRVWMDQATDADVMTWAALETKNTARVLAAAGRRQKYAAERLDAMRDHPGWSLGRIEREIFNYVEESEPGDFYDADDFDDDDGDPS